MSSDGENSCNEGPTGQDILDLFVSDREESFSGFSCTDENNNTTKKSSKTETKMKRVSSSSTQSQSKDSKGPGKGPGLNKKGKAKATKRRSDEFSGASEPQPGSSKKPMYDPEVLQELLEFCNSIDFDSIKQITVSNSQQPNCSDKQCLSTETDSQNLPSTSKSAMSSTSSNEGPLDLNKECDDLFETVTSDIDNGTEHEDEVNDFPQIFSDEIGFGDPIKDNIADFIVKCCTKQANIQDFLKTKKFKIPSNCRALLPTRLGPEIYNDLPPATRAGDAAVQDVQKLIGLAATPLLTILQMLSSRDKLDVKEAKKLLMDSLTLICNSHFELSIRRRYLLKRFLKRRFHQLCLPSNPIGETLFGSELTQKLKEIGESSRIMENHTKGSFVNRGFPKNGRRGSTRYGPRFQRGYRGSDRGRGKSQKRGGRDANYSRF